jgi:hypothetical protein
MLATLTFVIIADVTKSKCIKIDYGDQCGNGPVFLSNSLFDFKAFLFIKVEQIVG